MAFPITSKKAAPTGQGGRAAPFFAAGSPLGAADASFPCARSARFQDHAACLDVRHSPRAFGLHRHIAVARRRWQRGLHLASAAGLSAQSGRNPGSSGLHGSGAWRCVRHGRLHARARLSEILWYPVEARGPEAAAAPLRPPCGCCPPLTTAASGTAPRRTRRPCGARRYERRSASCAAKRRCQ